MESTDQHKKDKTKFDEHKVLHELKHYLPAQAPLKDFIHHNTLHAFQTLKFHDALRSASEMFGYKVSLSLEEYRQFFKDHKIRLGILETVIARKKGESEVKEWKDNLISKDYNTSINRRIGSLRKKWRDQYHIDIDSLVHPILFRIICSYLDQGISITSFPVQDKDFLSAIKELERNSAASFFKTKRARQLLLNNEHEIKDLLDILVKDESLYEQYLFDQQFAHQGWSGMVSSVEDFPETLLDPRKISLHDLITFELLLEIDALDYRLGEHKWKPLVVNLSTKPVNIFDEVPSNELYEVYEMWQEAFEWSYYDMVLAGIKLKDKQQKNFGSKNFQAFFCIDDREYSLRHYLETTDTSCETFSTPGFFSVEFFYQPAGGKFYTKLCPAPVTPKYLIKEFGYTKTDKKEIDVRYTHRTHGLLRGWLISQTVGFWAAFRLFLNVFKPSMSPATASSFKHMDKLSQLTIENKDGETENGLQIGYTIEEMANRVESLLKSTGLVKNFAPLVYMVGHGSSSVNNPHFAAYDCGACSGRPGSVNARVFCTMANNKQVRQLLEDRGIKIPEETQFIGALHDTTRDEIMFYDEDHLTPDNLTLHKTNEQTFSKALDMNAKERSRRFELVNTKLGAKKVHEQILKRSVSLFEPRPELNHATNSLCIIGRRELSSKLFLDRRAFLNSYDYRVDPEGKYLLTILNAAAPVCGGINLEYFFSRVDNHKLGAGTKLPHNVMGLFGVANGIDGDLRPGLPSQMIEVHDPIRLLMIVEHYPEIILQTIQKNPATYEWFINEWINLIALHPETHEQFVFRNGTFENYIPLKKEINLIDDATPVIESTQENIPVMIIK